MKDKHYSHHDVHLFPKFYSFFLLFDAAAFALIFFKGIESVLLIGDGVYAPWHGLLLAAGWTAALCALSALDLLFFPDRSANTKRLMFIIEIAFFFAALVCAYAFAAAPPRKGIDTLWIANQWRMLPKVWWLMAALSPKFTFWGTLALLAVIRMAGPLRIPKVAALTAAVMGVVVLIHIKNFPHGDKVLTYVFVFAGPFFLAAAAALIDKPRLFSRIAFGACLGILIFWSYTGFLPKLEASQFDTYPGVAKIYPRPGNKPQFPLMFMRDIELDPKHNAIYTTYGPACGVVKIDMSTGDAQVIEENGLVRFLRTTPDSNYIYGTNRNLTELVTLTKKPFRIAGTQNLFEGELIALWDHTLEGGDHFVGTAEYAGIAKYHRDKPGGKLRRVKFLNFHKLGLIKFKSGAYGIARDTNNNDIFIELGMIGKPDSYKVLRIDPGTMKIKKTGTLPEGGLELLYVPEHDSLIAASFFSKNLFELDAGTLKIRRSFKGPLNSRNVEYDAKRDLLYALSFLEGRLYIIRYKDMETLFHVAIGKRPNALALDTANDFLFVGSSEGIFRVDLKTYLSPVAGQFARPGRARMKR